jgi:hypothetical protein
MKDADGMIERLLAELCDAEPPAGIVQRILIALGLVAQKAAAVPRRTGD